MGIKEDLAKLIFSPVESAKDLERPLLRVVCILNNGKITTKMVAQRMSKKPSC